MATTGYYRAPATRRLSGTQARDLLLLGLTFASGAIDAISFLGLGKVFTAFMTGNLVFFGLRVGGAPGPDAVRVVIAVAGFAGGVCAATRIVAAPNGNRVWPHRVTAALAVAMLLQAIFLAVWVAVSGEPRTSSGNWLTALMALAMGLQSGAVAKLAVNAVFTTAATATLISLVRDITAPTGPAAEERPRLTGVLVALVAGATAGAALLVHARVYAPVLPLVATTVVVATASVALHGQEETNAR
jgi:uncharacterized membrane protein YoaK (UPF0700 family)